MIGQTVGNYEILEKIGEGGMGVVYRARDVRLDRQVALKFLSLERISNQELKRRFIQEAKAASALDHPNICTIHAIGETPEGQLFIAMAYYEGETVKAKMHRGLMSPREIIDIGAQVAAGLAAAHEQGIVHLDVKPANLIVTRDGTVKILDFGLSRFTSQVSEHSHSGPLMGTVAYMSPERVKGERAGPESDIWSLGVVLYEMATGTRPFQGGSDMSVLYAVVHREFVPPHEKVPDLPDELDRIIRRMLVKDRRYRYRSLDQLAIDIESLQASQSMTATVPWIYHRPWRYGSRPKRFAAGLLAVTVLLLLIGGVTWMTRHALYGGGLGQRTALPGPQRGLVTGFCNLGDPQLEWVGAALAELLYLELPTDLDLVWTRAEGDPLRVAFPGLVAQLGTGEGFRSSDLETLRLDSYGIVICGTFEPGEGGSVAVHLVIQDAADAQVIDEIQNQGSVKDLSALASWLAVRLPRIDPPKVTAIDQGLPSDPAAFRLLLRAQEKLRFLQAEEARELLVKALEIVPDNAVLRLNLVNALQILGRLEEAQEETERALAAAKGASLVVRAHAQIQRLIFSSESSRAVALAQSLWVGEEDPLRYIDRGLELVDLLIRSGQAATALEILAHLQEKEPSDARIPLSEAFALQDISRQRQISAADRAIEMAQQGQEASLLVANALRLKADGYLWLGDLEKANATNERALEIFMDEGDAFGQAKVLNSLGIVEFNRHDLVSAKRHFEEAARLSGSLGNTSLRIRMLINTANVLRKRGLYEASVGVSREALEEIHQINDPLAVFPCQSNLAEALWKIGRFDLASESFAEIFETFQSVENPGFESEAYSLYGRFLTLKGDLDEAAKELDKALAMQEEGLGNQPVLARTLYFRAELRRQRGDLEGAVSDYQRSRELFAESKDELSRVETGLGETLIDQGRLEEARHYIDAALEIQDYLSDPSWAAQSRLAQARILLLEERYAESVVRTEEVLADLAHSDIVLEKVQAYTLLALGLLGSGEIERAQGQVEEAQKILGKNQSIGYSLRIGVASALIQAAGGDIEPARSELQRLLTIATAKQLRGDELEIELALGQLQMLTGSVKSGRTHLLAVADSADTNGYRLLAEKARALAGP